MFAAIETLAELDASRKIAVLGLMAEVNDAKNAHAAVAMLCEQKGVELLALETSEYGTLALALDEIIHLLDDLDDSVVILVKGSRVAAVERIVQALAD